MPGVTTDLHPRDTVVPGDLRARYEALLAEPSDIVDHLARFVEMTAVLGATHVIELGTRTGVSTIAWLYGLACTGGRLTSVDLDPAPDIGEWAHWTFLQGDDLDPAILVQLEPAEIVFIDTSHTYEHTIAELNIYRWLVKPGGLLVCHDTLLRHPEDAPLTPAFPVRKALAEFVAVEGFDHWEYEDSWGLGIVRVT